MNEPIVPYVKMLEYEEVLKYMRKLEIYLE